MPIYTNDPCDDGLFPVGPSLRSSIGIGPKVTKAIDDATKDWLDDHPEATTTVEDDSITNAKLKDGSVNSRTIENESITTDDIADLAVTTPKIADLAVTTPKIADNAVTAQKIASAAVDGLRTMSTTQPGVAKVGAGLAMNNGALELDGGDIAPAVTAWLNAHPEATTTVVDGAITSSKIADGAVTGEKLNQDGLFPFAVADEQGKAAFYIDDNGLMHLNQINFKADANGLYHTDDLGEPSEEYLNNGLFDFAVCDKDGRILFYVDNGILKVDAVATNTIENSQIKYTMREVRQLNNERFENGIFDAEINMFICYGQSWAEGYDTNAITTTQRYNNIMLNTGIMNDPLNDMEQVATSFVPMVERTGTAGGQGTQSVGETPVSAQSNIVKQLIESENGFFHTDFPYQILGTSPGSGSKTLAQLSKGTDYYNRLIGQVQMAYDIALSLGKRLVVQAFSWAQGELGSGLVGTYAENLEQLRLDIDEDVKDITGQTKDVKCITWQAFLYSNGAAGEFYDRYVGASETYPNIICSGATYHLDNVASNNLHFTAESQDWLGAYFGVAYKRSVIDNNKFVPLKPISASHFENMLYVTFNVPQKPITIDTERVSEADNYGFNLYASDNTEKTITNVEIVSPDTLKIVCDSEIATTDYLTYAQNSGSTYGRTNGNRGNIRDSQGDFITYKSGIDTILPLHNWCVVFNKTIASLEA